MCPEEGNLRGERRKPSAFTRSEGTSERWPEKKGEIHGVTADRVTHTEFFKEGWDQQHQILQ